MLTLGQHQSAAIHRTSLHRPASESTSHIPGLPCTGARCESRNPASRLSTGLAESTTRPMLVAILGPAIPSAPAPFGFGDPRDKGPLNQPYPVATSLDVIQQTLTYEMSQGDPGGSALQYRSDTILRPRRPSSQVQRSMGHSAASHTPPPRVPALGEALPHLGKGSGGTDKETPLRWATGLGKTVASAYSCMTAAILVHPRFVFRNVPVLPDARNPL